MKQITQHYRTGELTLKDLPAPALRPGGVIVATRASLVSAGTEKLLMDLAKASLAGKAMARPDLVRQVVDKAKREGVVSTIEAVRTKLDNPVSLGYSCAGTIIEIGLNVEGLKVGDRVACAGAGYASHAEYNFVPKNLCVPVPEGVDDESAAFVTVGAIALQGVRQAQPTMGERIVVIGLGLLGQLTVQLLKANGCKVLGFDPVASKCDLARALGADGACSSGLPEAAEAFTEGHGADAVIVTASTKSDEPVNTAAEIARVKGRVVLVGMVGMNLQRDRYYRKELDLRLSMSYGPGRYDPDYEEDGRDYPFPYVRWTERRNMQAFLELIQEGRVTPNALITHRFDINDAERAYGLMSGDEPYLGIVITYPAKPDSEPARRIATPAISKQAHAGGNGVGFIGAGNFAKSVLLPGLKKTGGVHLTGVATATGLSGAHVAEKFGFGYATTDYRRILDDPDTATLFVATRHDLHAPLVCEALRAGKNVFVEKPLAIDRGQLAEVMSAAEESPGLLTVGFNRRFAPLIRQAKEILVGRTTPLMMIYRVNAGPVPAESWLQRAEGGGRIVGEVCHFVDTLQFLAGARPAGVHAVQARGHPDALSIQISFEDGSVGTIVYSSLGDRSFAKEYIEVFSAGRVIAIDDFRSATFVSDGNRTRKRTLRQDKGFREEFRCFLDAISGNGELPIGLPSLAATTETTFAIRDSIGNGR